MLIKELGEFNLIKRLSAGLKPTREGIIAGIGDDAAALASPEGKLLIVTTDMLVEDVHFRLKTAKPFEIGWKSMAANISDIAAMGGEPTYAFVSIGFTRQTKVEFADELYAGMKEIADIYSVDIVGGDTVSAPQIVINISLLGEVEPENLIRRSGAKIGDALLVTGDLGGADAGLAILENNLELNDTKKHLMPIPRVKEARILAKSGYVTSMIDISDGLASEVNHICEMSGTGAHVHKKDIPLSDNVRQVAKYTNRNPYDFALYGGEDYELLFTCQPDKVLFLTEEIFKKTGTKLTVVGKIYAASLSVTIEDDSSKITPLYPRGYDHFANSNINKTS